MSIKIKQYDNYNQYISHQQEKTLDVARRKKWLGEEWEPKLIEFRKLFADYREALSACRVALCLGARTGQEVFALREMGIDAIGIDLVPHEPLVIKGDVHDLCYPDSSIDFVFSNMLDHSCDPKKFVSEIERVLRPGGIALLQLYVGPAFSVDEYAAIEMNQIEHDVLPLFSQCDVEALRYIPLNFACMNREVLVRKHKWILSIR